MVSYISASYVYPVTSAPIKNGVLGVDSKGTIRQVLTEQEAAAMGIGDAKHYDGLLVPGFVNTHCHLELSSLRGKIDKHTGLPEFVQAVMKMRTADEYALDAAMRRADKEMLENGIVAVGDISNTPVSKMIKRGSLIWYHTFLETMGFNPDVAGKVLERAMESKAKFAPLSVSLSPHAPYSVSQPLFERLKEVVEQEDTFLSIHNQETADENAFFESKQGAFLSLYESLGLNIDFYKPTGRSSLRSYLPMLPPNQRVLLVHNTFTSRSDVQFARAMHRNLFWCLCPNANLYIENRLPDVQMLREEGLTITLGTDSLASNESLSIFAEMVTLQKHFGVPVEELLVWATWNGARFLGVDDRYGCLEVGKRPGINLLQFEESDGRVMLGSAMRRLY
ncbi:MULTISPECIES: amidohydrolase family protein [Pedobacter]|uniref:amidohydrolase family protein n=1 Tax=Pedobacter TaxID=84567 RepID=UPI002108688B|nr:MULTISPECIES: amidohydrolase family protein [unclassified Pedobacter]